MNDNILDVIVIGGGQAGLAAGYYLKQTELSFLIVEKHTEIGDSWRRRYDSLTLFSSRRYSALEGKSLDGEQDGYPAKDEIAKYLKEYAATFEIPVKLNTTVISLQKIDNIFHVTTETEKLLAKHIIVATGPFQVPFIPPINGSLSSDVLQMHSAQYRNPSQLQDGSVIIIGDGNSGRQIADELSAVKTTYLATGKRKPIVPQKILGKDIFWWMKIIGLSSITVQSKIGNFLKRRDPIVGLNLSLRSLQNKGVIVQPTVTKLEDDNVIFADASSITVDNIIWATGYRYDASWIKVDNLLDDNEEIKHERGKSNIEGLYFLGLPWQYTRGSALLLGVSKDAEYVVNSIETISSKA